MRKVQFRVLYREFLFRIVDLELLSKHAQGDSHTLLGQFASLLIFTSIVLALGAAIWAGNFKNNRVPVLVQLISAWTMEHFLIATTMLVVGLFAVLSWESTFPDRRDVMVLGPLPLRASTLFLAKVAAVGSALGLTVLALHLLAGIAWPLALAQYHAAPAPALLFDSAMPPVKAADFPAVMNRDIAPMLKRLNLAAADGKAGIVIGISQPGVRRVMTYGTAEPDSLFEIGSITKTFTGLLLAQTAVEGKLDIRDPVRYLLPAGVSAPSTGFEITLLDLATHHSGLPRMPDNAGPGDQRESYTNYSASDLNAFIKQHGLSKPTNAEFLYSNLGFAVLGAALASRANTSFADLVYQDITRPLGMKDTVISLSPEQSSRLMQGHDGRRQPTPRWDMDAFASAGGIRSSASDMLIYLEAELHPERTPLRAALISSQRVRSYVGNGRIALAWLFDPSTGVYEHSGATGGFSSFAFFDPHREFAAVGAINAAPTAFPFIEVLEEHVQQRLSGEPAVSLAAVSVPPAGPIRSFLAYWISMAAAATFTFCCILGLQGLAAQILPRRWYLRASGFLQLAVFCLLVCGYFLQQSPLGVLIAGSRHPWRAWMPSYWFVGLYQQVSGSLHPALAPFALRAWIGLIVALSATAIAYAASYLRTLRQIVEEPDIAPALRNAWLPRLGSSFEAAIVHFSVRTLFRSRQHRMIFAFYLGTGLAFAIFFLNAPPELSGPAAMGPWDPLSVPLLAATTMLVCFWVAGIRVVFSLPRDLQANWIFRMMPFDAARSCLRGRRRALTLLSVFPASALMAALLFSLWPWRPAAAHVALLVFLAVILSEFSFDGVQRIPFTCSYLPGTSKLHITFWFWIYVLLAGAIAAAVNERSALQSGWTTVVLLIVFGLAAAVCIGRNNWLASKSDTELRFEEVPSDQVLSLNLS
ncbi:MAG: beta-lactamase family protein [Acidobacteriaceae bacterium]|nr:beta-lactamase family protein [Acidobacteriaceae bacterium]